MPSEQTVSTDMSCNSSPTCSLAGHRKTVEHPVIERVVLTPQPAVADYRQAMQLANQTAEKLLGERMLLSWYDRDRNFESPQHASECHQQGATPGYVDYAIHHGATLLVDIEDGRFQFYYLPVDL